MGGIRAVFLRPGLSSVSLPGASPLLLRAGSRTAPAFEASSLTSIAGWLKRDGREGWLGADVADAVGIPRLATEDLLEARQRGFRDDEALRVVQVSADERRDFLLFMVQRFDGQVFFYLASLREGLKERLRLVRAAVGGALEPHRGAGASSASCASGRAASPCDNPAMEAERINQIASSLSDLQARSAELRRYL